jgi:hypothetical protein
MRFTAVTSSWKYVSGSWTKLTLYAALTRISQTPFQAKPSARLNGGFMAPNAKYSDIKVSQAPVQLRDSIALLDDDSASTMLHDMLKLPWSTPRDTSSLPAKPLTAVDGS